MSPLARRTFLRGALGAVAASVAGCAADDGAAPVRRATTTSTRPSTDPTHAAPSHPSSPTPEPTTDPAPSPAAAPTPTLDPSSASTLEVICRAAWGAEAAGQLTGHTVRQLTLHHTAVELDDNRQAPSRLRRHQDYHRSLGWPDIAYHVGVDRHGHAYELRRPDAAGDTGTDYDPAGHFLVVALGHYGKQEPTSAQLEGLARVLAWGAKHFAVDPGTLTGHREHASTSCPGDALQARIPTLRDRVAQLVAAGMQRRDLCGEEAEQRVAAIAGGRDEPVSA